jgi:signal transduction histidine kinase
VAADDHRRFFDFLARLGQESLPRTEDLHFLPRAGRPVPVSITVAADPDPGCGTLMYRWLVREIAERKRLEQALASERDHLEDLVTERTAALRGLASQLLLLEEAERRRLAVELHDSLGQNLAAIRLKLSEAEHEPAADSCATVLHDIDPLLAEVIESARTITRDLSPPTLHTFGLAAALDELCGEFSTRFGLTVAFSDDGGLTPGSLPLPSGILFFRSVRELLVNVGKHSGVTTASVSMTRIEDNVVVTVEDEGIGFDPAEAAARASRGECFGLFTIAERLTNSGGRFQVDSAPGRGTRITMVAPVRRPDGPSFNPLP